MSSWPRGGSMKKLYRCCTALMCLYLWSKLEGSFFWPLRLCVLLGLLCEHSVIKFGAEINSLAVLRHNIWSCSINSASDWAFWGNRWHCGGWGINFPQSMAMEAICLMNTFTFSFNLCSELRIRLLITVLAVIPANLSTNLLLWFIVVFNIWYSFSALILTVFFKLYRDARQPRLMKPCW